MSKISLFVVAVFLLAGCMGVTKAYPGASRGAAEVSRFIGHGVSIIRVDSMEISSSSRAVDVLPGKHLLIVKPNATSYGLLGDPNQLLTLEILSEPGKQYSITSKRGHRSLCAYEIAAETGKPDFQSSAGCFSRR